MSAGMSAIDHFHLFGETAARPEAVHCETIFARASRYDWSLTPHVHRELHQILLIARGTGRARLDHNFSPLGPGALVNVPARAAHGFDFEPGAEGWVISLAAEALYHHGAADPGLVVALSTPFVGVADAFAPQLLAFLCDECERGGRKRGAILRAASAMILGLAARAGAEPSQSRMTQGAHALLHSFEFLREEKFRERWSVADYAEALGVSTTHLSRVLRGATGRSTSQLLNERVMQEARRALAFSDWPVSSIAFQLGFDDPAYFTRVFTASVGVSPKFFRQRLTDEQ